MLACLANCIPSVVSSYQEWKTSWQAAWKGMEESTRIDEEAQKIFKNHVWEREHLIDFTRERLYLYCSRVIYFSCTSNSRPLPETEDQVNRLLIDRKAEQIIKVVFEEIISCADRMFAADILSLNLPPIGPDGERLDLKLAAPIFCQRPDSSLDEGTKIIKLYENIVCRDNTSALYQLENYHRKAGADLKALGITSGWPPVADVVYKVIKEKVVEILNEVRKEASSQEVA